MYRNKVVCVYTCSMLGSLGMEGIFSIVEQPEQHLVGIGYVPLHTLHHILKPIKIIILGEFICFLGEKNLSPCDISSRL